MGVGMTRRLTQSLLSEPSYDYGRILDLMERIPGCAEIVRKSLPDRTLAGNLRARNYAAQIRVDVLELEQLLLARHIEIQRESE